MAKENVKSLLLSGLFLAVPAMADDGARIRELEQKLERSMQLIEALSAKVQRLEQGTTAQGAVAVGEQQARVEVLERQVEQLGTGLSRRSLDEAVQLRGFADVGVGHSTENNARFGRGRKGFGVGNLDLYLTPQIGDRVRALVELALEVHDDGHTEADLERVQLGYAFSDAATAWLGRFHTPYGYWNTAYHHGAQLQTSITRPRFLDFEEHTGVLPAHTVGGWLTGSIPATGNRLGYSLYAGNAQRIEIDRATNSGKLSPMAWGRRNPSYISGFNAWLEPGAMDGLRLGVHGLRVAIDEDGGPNRTRLTLAGGYGVYMDGRWEVLGEYFHFRNRDLSGGTGNHRSWAGYVQAGYALGPTTPYIRVENARLNQADNYFVSQFYGRSYRRGVLGVRYDLDPRAAFKVELAHTDQGDLAGPNDRYSEALVQYSIRF